MWNKSPQKFFTIFFGHVMFLKTKIVHIQKHTCHAAPCAFMRSLFFFCGALAVAPHHRGSFTAAAPLPRATMKTLNAALLPPRHRGLITQCHQAKLRQPVASGMESLSSATQGRGRIGRKIDEGVVPHLCQRGSLGTR